MEIARELGSVASKLATLALCQAERSPLRFYAIRSLERQNRWDKLP